MFATNSVVTDTPLKVVVVVLITPNNLAKSCLELDGSFMFQEENYIESICTVQVQKLYKIVRKYAK